MAFTSPVADWQVTYGVPREDVVAAAVRFYVLRDEVTKALTAHPRLRRARLAKALRLVRQ